ncbi:MAG: pectate lyase family protein [Prosthecobacter sp.]
MHALPRLVVVCAALLACHHATAVSPVWASGDGAWSDAARWGGALPDGTGVASIEGESHVRLSDGDVMLSRLNVGAYHNARSALTMSGGQFTASSLVLLGESAGTSGRLMHTGGDLRALEICVGGANLGPGTTPGTAGELEVRGGSILTRHLTFGWASGSTARLHIVGSKARPIAVLDYLWIGIRGVESPGSAVSFDYDIDAQGVTPIVMWHPTSMTLIDSASRSTCRLNISLTAKPPVGDIPLIRLSKPCNGTFTDLPEGSAMRAEFGGQAYEWTLTYKGGASQCDIVLTQPQLLSADGKQRTAHTSGQPGKAFSFTADDVQSGLREMERRQTALLKPFEPKGLPAFPGAEGFGAHTPGGRGGKVLPVTNLDDSGPGSLRAALDAKGPRIVIFRVGGVIQLKSALVIREPFVTVAGQTAPGDGICLRTDSSTHADTLVLNGTHDVILRFLRVQNGKGPQPSHYDDGGDCISAYDSENFIIDHCSARWGCDEVLSVTGACDRYTVQWSILAEALNYNRHSMATILSGERCSWHHNLLAHNGSRNPLFAGGTRCDFRNNVLYNWGHTSGQGNFNQLNYAGNYLRPGPSTVQKPLNFVAPQAVALARSLHLAGNVMEGSQEITADNWLGAAFDRACASDTPFPMAPVRSESADLALPHVLAKAGATLPQRDAADTRVIADVQNHTGQIIASQQEVGGHPSYPPATTAVIDTDLDGLPDSWELSHTLNPANPGDASAPGPDGYTRIEKHLNELAEKR